MKTIFKIVLIALVITNIQIVSAQTVSATSAIAIQRIQTNAAGNTYFRPVGLGPWGGPGSACPTATYAYITKDLVSYDQIMSLALASKLNNSAIFFRGTCSADGNYLHISYAYLN